MSRLNQKPIIRPKSVEAKIQGNQFSAKGPKGNLEIELPEGIELKMEEDKIWVQSNELLAKQAFVGLTRARVANVIIGVSDGFKKELTLIGVGYKAMVKGNTVELALGYSHPCVVNIPEGVQVQVEKNTTVTVSGPDKQKVGQLAADIRSLRKPEPYKGKGVRYTNEYVRKKAGKTAK